MAKDGGGAAAVQRARRPLRGAGGEGEGAEFVGGGGGATFAMMGGVTIASTAIARHR